MFGETIRSRDGVKKYNNTLKNWQEVFEPSGKKQALMLVCAWGKWVQTEAKQIVLGSWTRKSIHGILATREENDQGNSTSDKDEIDDDDDDDDDKNDDNEGVEIDYGLDAEGQPFFGGGRRCMNEKNKLQLGKDRG